MHISDYAQYQSVEALVDSGKEVTESNERNNKKSCMLYYPQPGPWPPGPPGPFPPHLPAVSTPEA